jgi:PE family
VSFVNVAPETVSSSAGDLDGIHSALNAANAAAGPPTTGIAPPAMDQVSAAITAVLGTHALEYQAVSEQVADLHAQFVGALNSGASQYLAAEAANTEQSLLNAVNSPTQALLGQAAVGAGTGSAGALGGTGSPPLIAGGIPFAGTGQPEPASLPVLNTITASSPGRQTLTGTAGLVTGAASLASGSFVGPPEVSLGVDAAGPYLSTASALQSGGAAIGGALSGVRPVAVNALSATPVNAVKAFLQGQGATPESTAAPAAAGPSSSGVNVPVAGLLDSAGEGPAAEDQR